jgi:hypothetical protein
MKTKSKIVTATAVMTLVFAGGCGKLEDLVVKAKKFAQESDSSSGTTKSSSAAIESNLQSNKGVHASPSPSDNALRHYQSVDKNNFKGPASRPDTTACAKVGVDDCVTGLNGGTLYQYGGFGGADSVTLDSGSGYGYYWAVAGKGPSIASNHYGQTAD